MSSRAHRTNARTQRESAHACEKLTEYGGIDSFEQLLQDASSIHGSLFDDSLVDLALGHMGLEHVLELELRHEAAGSSASAGSPSRRAGARVREGRLGGHGGHGHGSGVGGDRNEVLCGGAAAAGGDELVFEARSEATVDLHRSKALPWTQGATLAALAALAASAADAGAEACPSRRGQRGRGRGGS